MSDKENEWSDGVNVGMQLGIKYERERIIDFFKSELVRMEKESPSGAYYHNAAGMKMAIQLLEGTYEDDWIYEDDE